MKIFISMAIFVTFICLLNFAAARPRESEGFRRDQFNGLITRRQGYEEGNKPNRDEKGRFYGGYGFSYPPIYYPYIGYGGYGYGYGGYGPYGGFF
ncbi:uncharacterized protein LOC136031626 [Artemia franciscana]|uniref:uncharacterized protein LOC136031626 n=1 Tax=Artemia franciscana TaxID=6661 RepID=UPI0032DB6B40